MTARSHETHFLSFRKQQMAIPRGKRRMALSNPRKVKNIYNLDITGGLQTYRGEGSLYITATICTLVSENNTYHNQISETTTTTE